MKYRVACSAESTASQGPGKGEELQRDQEYETDMEHASSCDRVAGSEMGDGIKGVGLSSRL